MAIYKIINSLLAVSAASDGNVSAASDKTSKMLKNAGYHTTKEIHLKLMDLASSCNGMLTLETERLYGVEPFDIVTIKKNQDTKRVQFQIHGVHAREYISPESGLHLIKRLCDENDGVAQKMLEHTDFVIFPVVNPISRKKVEKGETCTRTNENGVDLNRNYNYTIDNKPREESQRGNTYNGKTAHSELQTQFIVSKFEGLALQKKITFLDVHSGAEVMNFAEGGGRKMRDILETLNNGKNLLTSGRLRGKKRYGSEEDVFGERLDGISEAYFANKEDFKADYSFLFEIYEGHVPSRVTQEWACIHKFFPIEKSVLEIWLNKWSNIYLETAKIIYEQEAPECEQPKDSGPCRGNFPRYYYDEKSRQCELFTYGGCSGNDNNFISLEECNNVCPRGQSTGNQNRPIIFPDPVCKDNNELFQCQNEKQHCKANNLVRQRCCETCRESGDA